MATPEEIREQVSEDVLDGVAERQIADRRTRYMTAAERIEASQLIAAAGSTRGPFIRVGFRGRAV